MTLGRAILAAFIGTLLAGVFLLALKASKENDKSIPAALVDVPDEARKVYADVRDRTTDMVSKGTEMVNKGTEMVSKGTEMVNKGVDMVRRKGDDLSDAVEETA